MSSTERVFAFGPSGTLNGVLSEPAAGQRIAGAPGILFWNVGTNHHVGPHRVFVDLARRLAKLGFSSLRFDTSGLGDSAAARDDTRADTERNIADVRSAIQALKAQRGLERFVLVGFCSSVDAAHAVAVADPEVVGVVYLEGYQFRTLRFYLQYPARLLERNRWERLLRLKYPKFFGEPETLHDRSLDPETVFVRDYPTPAQLTQDIRKMAARGVQLLCIYSGGDTNYSYSKQFFDFVRAPELARKIEVVFYPSADHTFFLVEHRERVMAKVVGWLQREFGEGTERTSRAG
jgi:alpha-beta hydrolase superfamily lysophospholipase